MISSAGARLFPSKIGMLEPWNAHKINHSLSWLSSFALSSSTPIKLSIDNPGKIREVPIPQLLTPSGYQEPAPSIYGGPGSPIFNSKAENSYVEYYIPTLEILGILEPVQPF
jgi:hypothetical protein